MFMTRLTSVVRVAAGVAALALLAGTALAEEWHGFDPANFNGAMLPAARRKTWVADARKKTPAKTGRSYPCALPTWRRDSTFCQKGEGGIKKTGAAAPIPLYIADNRLDGATALANA